MSRGPYQIDALMTLDELAERFNVSRARVAQIERRALKKISRDPVLRQMARDLLGVEPDDNDEYWSKQ